MIATAVTAVPCEAGSYPLGGGINIKKTLRNLQFAVLRLDVIETMTSTGLVEAAVSNPGNLAGGGR